MKTENEIRNEIEDYENLIKEFYLVEDWDIRERFRAKIIALKWVLEED